MNGSPTEPLPVPDGQWELVFRLGDQGYDGIQTFSPIIDVSEPMGMETLVYFQLQGLTVCGKASPDVEAVSGKPMQLTAKLQNMHLIDDESGLVL